MASSIEDILYAKALAEASAPDMGVAVGVGAAGGALAGLIPGEMLHSMGKGVNLTKDLVAPQYAVKGDTREFVPRSRRLGTGNRFAGGLVGAILGGALGAGLRDSMIRSSPELQRVLAAQEITGTM
jgi:hypothetical protein